MSFSVLSAPLFVAGLAVLAGALFLLQRLRVRHREVEVPTVLFWREAIEEARARVLVQRFRHPLAYLLFLAIVSLMWLAIAGPRSAAGAGEQEYLVLLDRSAAAAYPGRFELGLEALREEVARLPRARTRVIDCGPHPRTLLSPGEDALLLERRLKGATPVPAQACVGAELWRAATAGDTTRELEVVVCGDAPLAAELLALLPAHVEVRRAGAPPEARANRGITSFGVSHAQSRRWDRVDVLGLVEGTGAASLADTRIAFTLDGAPLETVPERQESAGSVRFVLRDLPAEGGLLRARLAPSDALALDDEAALVLPERAPIRVALAPALDRVLRPVLALDPAVQLVSERPDVAILLAGDAAPAGVPALELVSSTARAEAFVVHHTGGADGDELAVLLETLGLTEIDVTELASQAARPIAVGMEPADLRGLSVWAELFSDQYDFTRTRAFPLFVASGVRWLAGSEEPVPFVAAGEPVPGNAARHVGPAGEALDPVGAGFVPPAAGIYDADEPDGAGALAVSLLDADATMAAALGIEALPARAAATDGWDATTWLALLALVLLAVEWTLYRSGRVP